MTRIKKSKNYIDGITHVLACSVHGSGVASAASPRRWIRASLIILKLLLRPVTPRDVVKPQCLTTSSCQATFTSYLYGVSRKKRPKVFSTELWQLRTHRYNFGKQHGEPTAKLLVEYCPPHLISAGTLSCKIKKVLIILLTTSNHCSHH